jgi:putative heme-binding domain-containing protein
LTVLLALLPAEQVRPLFRQFWANAALRDELARRFFPQPGAPDLAKVPAPQPPHAPGGGEADWPQWSVLLRSASWARGEPVRGEAIFHERGCAGCHAGASPLGPDLRPAVSRLKTEELFQTILYPDREVQESWRPTEFRLRDGRVITGLVVYESAHFWLVQTGPAATARLPKAGVLARRPATHSFMPGGLLNGLQPQDLASLYAWLKQLP